MRCFACIVSTAAVASIVLAASAASLAPAAIAPGAPRIRLQPAVATLGERATIAVSGIRTRSLEVLLAGAASLDGTPFPWRSLRLVDGVWVGTLPVPALLGVYPVLLRTAPGAPPIGPWRSFLRVFAPGTLARPTFDDPVDVARWWVRTVPGAKLVALKAWPRPGFDRRDVRLHRLFVVAYSPPGHPRLGDRLGMFVTAFRDGYRARWRLLEATVEP
jgi:hypothetical protein